ncbi:MAG: NfeD family protein [Pseudomonadota bacterium]
MGNVEVDGIRWRARLEGETSEAASGQSLKITATDGMTLILSG